MVTNSLQTSAARTLVTIQSTTVDDNKSVREQEIAQEPKDTYEESPFLGFPTQDHVFGGMAGFGLGLVPVVGFIANGAAAVPQCIEHGVGYGASSLVGSAANLVGYGAAAYGAITGSFDTFALGVALIGVSGLAGAVNGATLNSIA